MSSAHQHHEFEHSLRQAFQFAEAYRSGKGLTRRIMSRKVRTRDTDGPVRWVGPSSYKITLWLPPWSYAGLLNRKRQAGFPGSFTKFIERELGLKTRKDLFGDVHAKHKAEGAPKRRRRRHQPPQLRVAA